MLFRVENGGLVRISKKEKKLPEHFWIDLSKQIFNESHLLPFSAEVLEARYLRNETIIIINEYQIISHLSAVGVFIDGNLQQEGRQLDKIELSEPISAYLLLTGWTAVGFRKMGFSTFLRKQLLNEKSTATSFLLGVSANKDALPLLEKLNCIKTDHRTMPYVQVLSCINLKKEQLISESTKATQSFWVSNPTLAYRLNKQLQEAMKLSVEDWRTQIKDRIIRINDFLGKLEIEDTFS